MLYNIADNSPLSKKSNRLSQINFKKRPTTYFHTMNQFFQLFGGSIALFSSIIACIVVARKWRQNHNQLVRKHLLPLFYWGPIFLICCMALHIINNGLNTIALVSAGTSKFNFYQYSYQLFGGVLAYQSYVLLQKCKKHVEGSDRFNRSLFASMALILVTTLPTFIFTPIGIVPSVVLVINFIVSLLVHRPSVVESVRREIAVFNQLEVVEDKGVLVQINQHS
jgi:hypothetical protein